MLASAPSAETLPRETAGAGFSRFSQSVPAGTEREDRDLATLAVARYLETLRGFRAADREAAAARLLPDILIGQAGRSSGRLITEAVKLISAPGAESAARAALTALYVARLHDAESEYQAVRIEAVGVKVDAYGDVGRPGYAVVWHESGLYQPGIENVNDAVRAWSAQGTAAVDTLQGVARRHVAYAHLRETGEVDRGAVLIQTRGGKTRRVWTRRDSVSLQARDGRERAIQRGLTMAAESAEMGDSSLLRAWKHLGNIGRDVAKAAMDADTWARLQLQILRAELAGLNDSKPAPKVGPTVEHVPTATSHADILRRVAATAASRAASLSAYHADHVAWSAPSIDPQSTHLGPGRRTVADSPRV